MSASATWIWTMASVVVVSLTSFIGVVALSSNHTRTRHVVFVMVSLAVGAMFGDAFIHGTSHPIGIEVHDITPDGPFAPGMVVTVEPGIYLPERRLGVRIEDDVLITDSGNRVLTSAVPKSVDAIEAAMRRRGEAS